MGRLVELLAGMADSRRPLASLVLLPSAADRLPFPWGPITRTPPVAVACGGAAYAFFFALWLPLYLISFAVTSGGAGLVLAGGVVYGGRALARALSFPGSSSYVRREIEKEYAKYTAARLAAVAMCLKQWLQVVGGSSAFPGNALQFRELHRDVTGMFQEQGLMSCLAAAVSALVEEAGEQVPQQDTDPGDAQAEPAVREAPMATAGSTPKTANKKALCLNATAGALPTATAAVDACGMLTCNSLADFVRARGTLLSSAYRSLQGEGGGTGGRRGSLPPAKPAVAALNGQPSPRIGLVMQDLLKLTEEMLALAEAVKPPPDPPDEAMALPGQRCVLFCNPNAGFYEGMCLGAGTEHRDWASYYSAIGCHVFLFNYRGFGRSQGVPTPARLQADACEAVQYLRERQGMQHVMVHGESIGGMVAAAAAARCQVDLAVLDRTFSSLPAAAQRLMGTWTNPAMWALTQWSTNVARDFIACDCAKLVACDPEDVIIADTASLKAGVALMCELGRSTATNTPRRRRRRQRDTAATLYSRLANASPVVSYNSGGYSAFAPLKPPHAYVLADHAQAPPPPPPLRAAVDGLGQGPVSVEAIVHFAACVRDVGRRATAAGKYIKRVRDVGRRGSAAGKARRSRNRSDAQSHSPHGSGGAGAIELTAVAAAARNGTLSDAESGHNDGNGSSSDSDSSSSSGGSIVHKLADDIHGQIVEPTAGPRSSGGGGGGGSGGDGARRPLARAWRVLAATDGLCARPLGRAAAGGYDDVRSWVCSCLVWGPRLARSSVYSASSADGTAAAAAGGPAAAARELRVLMAAHPRELSCDASLLYAVQFLEYMAARLAAAAGAGGVSGDGGGDGIGWLLPLSCGHNSPLSFSELEAYGAFLSARGWVSSEGCARGDGNTE
ncbi:hypothetical protein JKP88DRAFT_350016 [Tribonema minus]|uniref:Serine aminopeptidase S33 domain-containing protein n=1 Tax=Tribonema minus TaxID=303371 RepID=A0A835YTB0_9STRA|nr:hypothetical protein JKP88DRAFT_350016 [Tribonema minus]